MRRAFWLILYSLVGRYRFIRGKMPRWLLYEKFELALSIAKIDRYLGVNAVFAFRKNVNHVFPSLKAEIESLGFKVIDHWHEPERREGINEWKARGSWKEIDRKNTYLNYDRHYMEGERVTPRDNSNVIWHIDHMPFNLHSYLEFLEGVID